MAPLRVKRLAAAAQLPRYATEGAAGMDLAAAEEAIIAPSQWVKVKTGLSLEIPPGFEGQIRPRSGLAVRHGVTVLNAPGTIDSDYRGEVMVALINHGTEPFHIAAGDRVAQLILAPTHRAHIVETEQLATTDRGQGGFGSTGR